MQGKTKILQNGNTGWKESAPSYTTNFLNEEEEGRELALHGELRSNSEIGWEGKKGNYMVKN